MSSVQTAIVIFVATSGTLEASHETYLESSEETVNKTSSWLSCFAQIQCNVLAENFIVTSENLQKLEIWVKAFRFMMTRDLSQIKH